MDFKCPEGCKAYYGVNGEELDLNATQGTVDLKFGQKRVNMSVILSISSKKLNLVFTNKSHLSSKLI